jgi:uncharacterized protein
LPAADCAIQFAFMEHDEILRLTEEYGGAWAVCHAQRILNTVAVIADGAPYAAEPLWLAAHLHDWGGYARWAVAGVDHAVRSTQVAREFLAERSCPAELAARVLECIEFHHGGPAGRSFESTLFTDADALDLLGTVGVLRIFAMNYRDLRAAVAAVRRYREMSERAVTLPVSRRIAVDRLQETDRMLKAFEEQTAGVY